MLLLWLTISIATLPNSLSTSRDGTVGVDDNPLESAHVDPMPSLTAVPLV
jgi:hypothetical protein